jgi:hypothetical protein
VQILRVMQNVQFFHQMVHEEGSPYLSVYCRYELEKKVDRSCPVMRLMERASFDSYDSVNTIQEPHIHFAFCIEYTISDILLADK